MSGKKMKFKYQNPSNEENKDLSSTNIEEVVKNDIVEKIEEITPVEENILAEGTNNSPSQPIKQIKYTDNITDEEDEDDGYEKLKNNKNTNFSFFKNTDTVDYTNNNNLSSFNFNNTSTINNQSVNEENLVTENTHVVEEPKDSVFADIYNTEELENLRVEKEKKSFFKKSKNKKSSSELEVEDIKIEENLSDTNIVDSEIKDEIINVNNLNAKPQKNIFFGKFKKKKTEEKTIFSNTIEELENLEQEKEQVISNLENNLSNASTINPTFEDSSLETNITEEPIEKAKKEKKSLFSFGKKKKNLPLSIESIDEDINIDSISVEQNIVENETQENFNVTDNKDLPFTMFNEQKNTTETEEKENLDYPYTDISNEENIFSSEKLEDNSYDNLSTFEDSSLETNITEEPIEKAKKEKKSLFGFGKKKKETTPEEFLDIPIHTEELDIISNQQSLEQKEILDISDDIKEEKIEKQPKPSLFDKFKKKEKKSLNDLDDVSDLISTREDFEQNEFKKEETTEKEHLTFDSFVDKLKPQEESVQSEYSLSKFEELSEEEPENEDLPFTPFEQQSSTMEDEVEEKEKLEITETPSEEKTKKKIQIPIITNLFSRKKDKEENIPNIETEEQILSSEVQNPLFEGGQDIPMSPPPVLPTQQPVPQPTAIETPSVGTTNILNNKKLILIIIGALLLTIIGTSIFTAIFTAKMVQPQQQTTPAIDQDAVDKAVEEALNKIQSFNEINKAETNIISKNDTNELPPQLGMDMLGEEKTNNDTTSVRTNNFNLGNVSFSYPSDWQEFYDFTLKTTPSNVSNIVMLGTETTDAKKTNNMRVTTETLIQEITAKDYISKTEELMKENFPNLQIRNSEELTVSGREAPTRIYSYELNGNKYIQYQVYIADRDTIYIISFTSGVNVFEKNIKYYNEILKSFRI